MEAEMDSFSDDYNKLSFFDCFDEGDIDMMKYMLYYEMEAEEEQLLFGIKCSSLQSKEDNISKGERGESVQRGTFTMVRGRDILGKPASPIELLVLGLLHYLGRGLMFDDLEEYTVISEEADHRFFHKFVEHGKHILFPKFVVWPKDSEELSSHTHEYSMNGFSGAPWSTDITYIHMENCSA
eukprot:3480459-Ditylum_brightwellii.AAC.1